jgi:hypothetical protein
MTKKVLHRGSNAEDLVHTDLWVEKLSKEDRVEEFDIDQTLFEPKPVPEKKRPGSKPSYAFVKVPDGHHRVACIEKRK